jgi:spermidine synthase
VTGSGKSGMMPAALGMPAFALRTVCLYAALVLTGASALVYQVAWGRMLRGVFGVGDLAVAAVLGAYFLGLGFGSLAGGRLSRRLARPALGYAALELFVGLYALASLWIVPLLRDAYQAVAADLAFETMSLLRLGLSMIVLLPPTFAMGASMPVALAAASGSEAGVPVRAALAYALNTLGAMAGAAAAGFWLIASVGLRASVILAALGSAVAAVLVMTTWRSVRPTATPAAEPTPSGGRQGRPALAAVLVLLGGFVSLGSEVLWTRALGLVVHGTTQAFASMLTTFLLGITIGSALATRSIAALVRPARAYAWTQAGVAAATLVALKVTSESPRIVGLLSGSQDLSPTSTWVLFALGAITLLPLAVCVGATIPIAWRLATGGGAPLGSVAARVLAANTLGGLCGALFAALVLIPLAGIDLSALVLLGLALLGAAIAARADAGDAVVSKGVALALPALAYALVLLTEPSVHLPFLLRARESPVEAVFEGPDEAKWSEPIVFLREGRNATVTVQKMGTTSLRLLNDGRPESGLSIVPPGFGEELILQATLPSPGPRQSRSTR